jgi:Protein of unknown function (DUF2530)
MQVRGPGRGTLYAVRVSVSGSRESPEAEPTHPGPPPLPPLRGAGLAHITVPITVVWFGAFVVLLFFIPTLQAKDNMVWLWTALAGWVLGLIGLSVYAWQRRAARRGTRGSSRMALEESLGSRTHDAT